MRMRFNENPGRGMKSVRERWGGRGVLYTAVRFSVVWRGVV